jgi:catechol 2,3-dioxygenase-like lactoylglutathione lyase family enzyme
MFDHIGLHVRDVEKSRRFYKALLAPLGYVLDSSGTGFGPKDAPALWLYEANSSEVTPVHVAFRAASRKVVDRFHKAGLEAGGRENGAPGLRTDYSPTYYAAFLTDPDGNNVEAVCLAQES